MRANTKKKSKMNTEGTDISTSFTADPENTKVPIIVELVELALMDCPDAKLALDCRNQRWALEESTGESFEGALELSLSTRNSVVEADNTNILFSGTLLGFDQTSSTINANNQATSDLGIKCTAVPSLFRPISTRRIF